MHPLLNDPETPETPAEATDVLSRVKGRVAAGQSRDEAIDAVLQTAREWLEAETESEAE